MNQEQLECAQEMMRRRGIRDGVDFWTNAVMVAEALHRGLEIRAGQRQRLVVSDGRARFGWMDGATNFNTLLARRCAKQKEITSRLLRSRNVPAPENAVFSPGECVRAYGWAESLFPVVVKPYNGNQGRGVHMDIEEFDSFHSAFSHVQENFGEVLVEKQLLGIEHRVLVVAGRVVAATRRLPAHVIGDGSHSIIELIAQKNSDRGLIHKPLLVDERVERHLKRQGLSLDDIPRPHVSVALRPTSNLHTGGDAIDATDDLQTDEVGLVEKASAAIPGLRLAGYDVLLPREGVECRPSILEVNPSPMISMHHFPWRGTPRNAAARILDAMFPKSS